MEKHIIQFSKADDKNFINPKDKIKHKKMDKSDNIYDERGFIVRKNMV